MSSIITYGKIWPIFNNEINKILYGMLKVLELDEGQLSIAKIYSENTILTEQNWQQVLHEINMWQPEFILQLDKKTFALHEYIYINYK